MSASGQYSIQCNYCMYVRMLSIPVLSNTIELISLVIRVINIGIEQNAACNSIESIVY